MTMEQESGEGRRFVRSALPWIVAVVALVVYLLTLNHWVSLLNLGQVAGTAGWKGQSEFLTPVYYILTFPLRWLPAKWIPLALNLFSAACAALTLAQLARSVALLPHDRTDDQRERERSEFSLLSIPLAWLPPVMAVLVCGLQLTFWELSTNGTSEMLDLLMFAYVIRSLLEYRVDEQESHLFRAAFVCGAGITNNFAMLGFSPAFLVALVWLRGLTFFNSRFLGRMMLCGLAGLSLYLLLPLIASLSQTQPIGFLEALKFNLLLQKNILVVFPKKTLLLLSLTSLVPVLLVTIRWGLSFGDPSKLGVTFAKVMFHIVHGAFLLICLWVVLDPPFSPRNVDFGNPALKLYCPFLTFYYLGALSIGYLTGYFLLVFRVVEKHFRRTPPLAKSLHQVVTVVVLALFILVPASLLYRNLPQIRATNGPILRQFADALAQGLPKSGVLLSDDLRRLVIIQAWLAEAGREKDYTAVHTESLKWPAYHRYLHKRYPQKWPAPVAPKRREPLVEDTALVELMRKLAKDSEIWYLHPSFGYYFEVFFDEPHGLTHKLTAYSDDSLLPPPLMPQLISENEAFWTRTADEALKPIVAIITRPAPELRPNFVERLFQKMHLPREQNVLATSIGSFYSRALNSWGVELQQANEFERAAARFDLGQQLNPDNVVAEINLQYNREFRAGRKEAVQLPKSIEDRFGKYRSWEQILAENGPYDEPSLTYAQAYVFLQGRLYRQAAQSFDRVRTLSLEDLTSRLWLAQLHLMANLPDKALAITAEIRASPELAAAAKTNLSDVLSLEATAYFARKEPEKAAQVMEDALAKNPTNAFLFTTVARLYADHGMYPEAQATLDRLLKITPDDPTTLINKSVVHVQANDHDAAIQTLNRVLTLQPTNNLALFYRAIAYLRSDKLDAAREDYQTLQRLFPKSFQVYFGLGEIAYRQKDTNTAMGNYQAYLTNAAPDSAESKFVSKRLKELKGEKSAAAPPKAETPKAEKR
jgi:tetratricopeptide (TPR) repeat protein